MNRDSDLAALIDFSPVLYVNRLKKHAWQPRCGREKAWRYSYDSGYRWDEDAQHRAYLTSYGRATRIGRKRAIQVLARYREVEGL